MVQQLFVSGILALAGLFIGIAFCDGIRNQVHFKTRQVTAIEVVSVIVIGVVVMTYGHRGAIGTGIVVGGLMALGLMNLIYATAPAPVPATMPARRTQ